jgi:hypothetical protein
MHQTRAKLRACAARNTFLHGLLNFSEFPSDDELINGELIMREIQANLRVMRELLPPEERAA